MNEHLVSSTSIICGAHTEVGEKCYRKWKPRKLSYSHAVTPHCEVLMPQRPDAEERPGVLRPVLAHFKSLSDSPRLLPRLLKSIKFGVAAVLMLTLATPVQAAKTRYITDEFEVTMRSGTSISNSIVRMLKSGQSVTILEENLASQYSLVEIEDGKQGYVLNRYLVDTVSAKKRLEDLQNTATDQESLITVLQSDVSRLETELSLAQSDNESLKNTLLSSEHELSTVRDAASSTLDIIANNKTLTLVVTQLRNDISSLNEENMALKDSTRLDWLVRGAGVTLVAFIIGILVTRIRWRKQDSWGSY